MRIWLLAFFLIGCASPVKKTTPAKEQVAVKEAIVSAPIRLKPIREFTLDNGLKVLFIRDNSLPRVSFALLVHTGVREEANDKGGVNALTASLLEQGTSSKSASQIADEYAELGTDLSISPGVDATMISTDALATSSDQLLNLFYETMSSPSFKDSEIQRLKAQFVAAIKKRSDNPSEMIEESFQSTLFEGHSYQRTLLGDQASLKKIRKQDIVKHYLNWYRPNNAALAVVGSFNEAFEKKVVDIFKAWPQRTLKKIPSVRLDDFIDFKMKLISKPGLAQTQIRIGQRGVQRQNPDYLKLRLVNEILGGGFTSRLNQRIRDDLGLTYSIGSFIDARYERGSIGITTFTKNESVGQTIAEALKVLEEYVANGANEAELRAAKNLLIGQFPRIIETADHLARNYLYLDFYGIPRSYLSEYNRNIEKTTLVEVNEIIKKYYSPRNQRIVIYGDQKLILEQLKSYSPEVINL